MKRFFNDNEDAKQEKLSEMEEIRVEYELLRLEDEIHKCGLREYKRPLTRAEITCALAIIEKASSLTISEALKIAIGMMGEAKN